MMTIYFPSLLLTAITFANTFIKPFFFDLVTMFVMTSFFTSRMEGLPSTSDIRMIDIWLILCQLLPFIEVVLLTAMEFFREHEMTGKEQMDENKETTAQEISRNEHYINVLKFVGKQGLL